MHASNNPQDANNKSNGTHVASTLDELRIRTNSDDAYSQTSSSSYLDSEVIKSAKKRRKRKKILTVIACSFLAVLLTAGVAVGVYFGKISSNLNSGVDKALLDALVSTDTPSDPFYVLLMGVDRSEDRVKGGFGEAYRSDSMMLARIDPKAKKATIISIPRDTKVNLGQYGENKINAAHFFGGPALAVKTVSELAGVPISHYAEIDFDGFGKAVDSLGGIEVDVPIEINDKQAGGHLMPGRQTLNGSQALILCRSRHSYDDYGDGDYYRTANQRVVLSAIANKLLQSDPMVIASAIESISESVLTDMKLDEIIAIAQNMRGMDASKDIYTGTAPSESKYIGDIWYDFIDMEKWKAMMKRVDAGEPPAEDDIIDELTGTVISSTGTGKIGTGYSIDRTQSIRIRNGIGVDGVSAEAKQVLSDMGYRKFDVGNANKFNFEETLVVYKETRNKEFADQMLEAFGCGRSLKDDGSYLFESDYLVVIGADWENRNKE